MTDLFDNPMGLMGFEFVEFTAPEEGILEPIFKTAVTKVATHRTKNVHLWRQGGINLITNYEPNSASAYYAAEHGPSACAMGFRVRNAQEAYELALSKGADRKSRRTRTVTRHQGIGGAMVYLIDRFEDGNSIYDIDFVYLDGVDKHPKGCGLILSTTSRTMYTKGVWTTGRNTMSVSSTSVKSLTLTSRAVCKPCIKEALTAPDGLIRIPLNEEKGEKVGQIEEYLREYKGEGIQHIAFSCDNLVECWKISKQPA